MRTPLIALSLATVSVLSLLPDVAEAGRRRVRVHTSGGVSVSGQASGTVQASGGVRVSGGVHVSGGVQVGTYASPPRRPRVVRPRIHVGFGGGYYYRPVPSYYYYPQQPVGYAHVAAPIAVAPGLSRWGLGVMGGGVSIEGEHVGEEMGLLGRFRLTPALQIEGELAETRVANDLRRDVRMGAGLIWEMSPHAAWSLQGVGELGATQTQFSDGEVARPRSFAELGLGLRLRLTDRLHLSGDVRAGSREAIEAGELTGANGRLVAPANETEEYTRAPLTGIVYF